MCWSHDMDFWMHMRSAGRFVFFGQHNLKAFVLKLPQRGMFYMEGPAWWPPYEHPLLLPATSPPIFGYVCQSSYKIKFVPLFTGIWRLPNITCWHSWISSLYVVVPLDPNESALVFVSHLAVSLFCYWRSWELIFTIMGSFILSMGLLFALSVCLCRVSTVDRGKLDAFRHRWGLTLSYTWFEVNSWHTYQGIRNL